MLFFLPTYTVLDWLYTWNHENRRVTSYLVPESRLGRVITGILNRIDILGVFDIRPPR